MKSFNAILLLTILYGSFASFSISAQSYSDNYIIVDTGQNKCFNNQQSISFPSPGEAFYGQDAQFKGNQPQYQDNGDGTITDLVTGLMWQKSADMDGDGDIDAADKVTYEEAFAGASTFNLGGYADWRLPTIKELYSLILFSGVDPSGWRGSDTDRLAPFIDTKCFDFAYGDQSAGERIIDAQYVSITKYDTTTMINDETAFGVNFADGRIKGYGLNLRGSDKTFFVKYVRDNIYYGLNNFVENNDGTITDLATGLMWQQDDSQSGLNWRQALDYAEELELAGYDDWRLPNVKELQSLVDYSRAPETSGTAAIDPLFNCSTITAEDGKPTFPWYWSNTTHENMMNGMNAAYVCFGQAFGWMQDPFGTYRLLDVHGAGAQRSDPKQGDPNEYPYGRGPQGDVIRIYNYVRCVRDAGITVPVELYGFNAETTGKGVALNWTTGSETSNFSFEIERRIGQDSFNKIAFIPGNGIVSSSNKYGFEDLTAPFGIVYYRLKQIDLDGTFTYSSAINVTVSAPDRYSLDQNFPNPFNPETTIVFSVPKAAHATLMISNLLGQHTATLVDESFAPGKHSFSWTAFDQPSGVYLYTLNVDGYRQTKKMLLIE